MGYKMLISYIPLLDYLNDVLDKDHLCRYIKNQESAKK